MEIHQTAFILALVPILAACGGGDSDADPPVTAEAADSVPSSVANVGFMTPESVLHDTTADIYLVTNMNGGPLAKDNNGFISRLSSDGQVMELQWIVGGADGATLHSPKGMALLGDSLFVADIDTVRIYSRATGATLGAWGVEGALLLNDVAIGDDGTVHVSDTGFRSGATGALEPGGTDAIYRFGADGEPQALARGSALQNPNGITVTDQGALVVTIGGNEVFLIEPSGQQSTVATLPQGRLDGVLQLDDGTLLVSSWHGSAVYRVAPGGEITTEVEGVDAPADIGFDATRRRLLIPLFNLNSVEIRELQ